MNCINIKSTEFNQLLEATQLPSIVLELKISKWQSENNSEDFPTSEELLMFKPERVVENLEISENKKNIRDLLDDTQEPMFVDSVDNNDREVLSNKDSNIKVLFGESINGDNIENVLINIMHSEIMFSDEGQELIKQAHKLAGKSNVGIRIVEDSEFPDDDIVMGYSPRTHEILISFERLSNLTPEKTVQHFLHEFAHAQTVDILRNPKTLEEQDFQEMMNDYYSEFQTMSDSYGFENVLEFTAELYANPDFRKELRGLIGESMWSNFINAIRRIFGLKLTSKYNNLIDGVVNQVEKDKTLFVPNKNTQGGFLAVKDEKVKVPSLTTLNDKLDNFRAKAQDNMDNALKRTKASNKHPTKQIKEKHVKALENLVKQMDTFDETEKWKVVLTYTESLNNVVGKLYSTMKKKDFDAPSTLKLVNHFEEYLASYDLIGSIRSLISASSLDDDLTDEDKEDIIEIELFLDFIAKKHAKLVSDFKLIKEEAGIRLVSEPQFIKQVETAHRDVLRKEYVKLVREDPSITESQIEYITRMMNTRDKDLILQTQKIFAAELINSPSHDISALAFKAYDSLNITSKLIDVVTQITSSVRDKIITQFTDKDHELAALHKQLVKEKGNLKVSELYKSFYEQNAEGEYFLKGKYKVEFRDKYFGEFIPILNEFRELRKSYKEQGIKAKEYKKYQEFIDIVEKKKIWLRENTKADKNSTSLEAWVPIDKYLNTPLVGIELQVMNAFQEINKNNRLAMNGMQGLNRSIRNQGEGLNFFKLPSITKTDLERTYEGDIKGIFKDKWTDLTTIKTDDIGFDQAISSEGNEIRHVKIHFRGAIEAKDQSLDLMTMFRKEALNGINYKEKAKEEMNLKLLYDISMNKSYLKKSSKTGEAMQNQYNTRDPFVTESGEFSNEAKKIKGIIESNIYDIMSYGAGTIAGTDVNKVVSAISGYTASISMTFNVASGTANVLNGMTQLFIESLGNQFLSTKSLIKAEMKYTADMPNIIADLGEPSKKSFTNQVVNMFDLFGGFSPEEQSYIQNTVASKILAKETLNAFNAMGEHMMSAVLTMGVLDTLKVMNADHKFIDVEGNEVTEDKAASLLDMLAFDKNGTLRMSPLVAHTSQNMMTNYHEGGKSLINLLLKKKAHDLFGVYDPAFQNELYKVWYGKALMMFKKFFISGMQARWKGGMSSHIAKENLTDEQLDYNAALKEYEEGSYTSLIRFFAQGVLPIFKGAQMSNISEYYGGLSDYEKGNVRKATVEIVTTLVVLPMAAALLIASASKQEGDDDDYLWFLIYQNRRLQSELSQFRSVIESAKLIQNPAAGVRTVQNASALLYDILTPLDFYSKDNEHFFSYLNEDSKGKNKMVKQSLKLLPVTSQNIFDGGKDYKKLYNLFK